ncbi:MAG: glutamate--cysteine ligase [Acidobacteria bacterium]|nr:glutamate--cysteine ligase [Acidobacteriota bacterium]
MSDSIPEATPVLRLFEGFGVELEYMIVDRRDFRVLPIADQILLDGEGKVCNELEQGALAWSNELVLHVVELKTNGPVPELAGLDQAFHEDVCRINERLNPLNARLMPAAAHPLMDPDRETRLWPHDNSDVYRTFDGIFNCRGHGWANLQSVHLNLPFNGDDEFTRLHGAIRLVLPLVPAVAASSPYLDGRETGHLDSRLEMYRKNCSRIFSVTGHVVPESVKGMEEYQTKILQKIYDDLSPFDPDGILRYEWVNARGAIARFDRNTIEIRVVDVQECPKSDLALLAALSCTLEHFTAAVDALMAGENLSEERLASILLDTIRDGENAVISDKSYLSCLGFSESRLKAAEIWHGLLETLHKIPDSSRQVLEIILNRGTLANRMKQVTGECNKESLTKTCGALCECLEKNCLLIP